MLSVIVTENGATRAAVEKTVKAIQDSGSHEIILIGQEPVAAAAQHISSLESSLSYCFKQARASSETVVVLDARFEPDASSLASFFKSLEYGMQSCMLVSALQFGSERMEIGDLTAADIVSHLSTNRMWPAMCYAIKRSYLMQEGKIEGKTSNEIFVRLCMSALNDGEEISSSDATIQSSSSECSSSQCYMSEAERSRCLRSAINSYNIEDLFPSHPWQTHQKESAAASYHSLAATFIRLGDRESAVESLALSDTLEDSPRSLALKGILSYSKGETLGAVANMVASLQQYELRKQSPQEHYVTFSPNNLEVINVELKAGLEALNKRDNTTAAQHFAEAVFHFDGFYKEHGIEGIKRQ